MSLYLRGWAAILAGCQPRPHFARWWPSLGAVALAVFVAVIGRGAGLTGVVVVLLAVPAVPAHVTRTRMAANGLAPLPWSARRAAERAAQAGARFEPADVDQYLRGDT